MYPVTLASLRSWTVPGGSPEPWVSPEPLANDVVVTGMSQTAQCQNPAAVGASGSYMVTAKLLVSAGNPDQDNCGDVSLPPAPICPLT